jgi:hypothetical protein
MTEYEYIDAMATLRDSVGFHAMNYITILFAYLVAGYFAGQALSRFQAIAVTMLYIILCPMPGIAAYAAAVEYTQMALEFQEKFRPEEQIYFWVQYFHVSWLVVFPATLTLSIVFMVQSRLSGGRRASAT